MPSPIHSIYRQRGVALFFALIVLVILMIGGVMVAHTVNSSLFGVGNLAFRRDLVTQSDTVVGKAIQVVSSAGTGASGAIPDLKADYPQAGYSASILPANAQGIPNVLLTGPFDNVVTTPAHNGVTIRYAIERMCNIAGAVTASNCVQTSGQSVGGGSGLGGYTPPPAQSGAVIYRLSARVSGPRATEAFFQTMFSGPN